MVIIFNFTTSNGSTVIANSPSSIGKINVYILNMLTKCPQGATQLVRTRGPGNVYLKFPGSNPLVSLMLKPLLSLSPGLGIGTDTLGIAERSSDFPVLK